MSTTTRQAVANLGRRLRLPEQTTDVVIRLAADQLPTITITRLLTPHEIEQLSTWYVVEGLESVPRGETTYDLIAREPAAATGAIEQVDPGEQNARQARIEQLYLLDGRDNPDHPRHGTYTALATGEGAAAA